MFCMLSSTVPGFTSEYWSMSGLKIMMVMIPNISPCREQVDFIVEGVFFFIWEILGKVS
jgi:hypothetical protein